MEKRQEGGLASQADATPGRPVAPGNFTKEQLQIANLISSRFCEKFQQTLSRYRRTRVNASLLGAEYLPFWIILNCLPFGYSTALAQCQPSGGFCLVEVGQELLKAFCGQGTRTYELGRASEAAETHPDGFYSAPVAEINATGFLVMPPRVVHVLKNGERTLEVAAVAIESVVPVALYSIVWEAWKWAWVDVPCEFEILGYDHDLCLLEQFMPPLTPMMVFGFEVQIGDDLGIINISVPGSIMKP